MKTTFLKTAGLAILAVALLTTFASRKALSDQGGGGRLEGAWDVQLTPRNCITGDALRPPFPELVTFMFGGTMLDSTAGAVQAFKTPGHGVWSHVSGDTYHFTFKILNFDPSNNAFSGWTIVTQDAVLNSDASEYASAGTAQAYNTSGAPLGPARCSTTTATRFE